MERYTILNKKMYEQSIEGGSVTGNLVEVIGEQTVRLTDGRVVEQFLYNIVGYKPANGKPFAALKSNIFTF